jgi:hypothetical protein
MQTHLVRTQLVSLAVLVIAGGPVSAQEHRPLSFALGANVQDATFATNISSLGVVAGFGFEWPVGHTLALRADAAYSHFGKSLFSETIADCATSPCSQPPNRFATFSTALDVVIRPSMERLHYIVGVSRDHVVESVMSGPRAVNALDAGAGLQLGPHTAIEVEIQWLEQTMGPTRWMAPIRIRWR